MRVAHARQRSESHRAAIEAEMLRAVGGSPLKPPERARIERFISNSSRRTRHFHQEPTHFHYPGLPEIEFHDRAQFPEPDRA